MILSEAIIRAIFTAWDASGINSSFTNLWSAQRVSDGYPPLTAFQAAPDQPFPYAVVAIGRTETRTKMSGPGNTHRAVKATDVSFSVYNDALKILDTRTPKRVAADLSDEIMAIYGGSNDQVPAALTFSTGSHLGTYYQRDFPTTEDGMQVWTVEYVILSDIAVAL